jgi:hypothetical protein
MNIFLSIINESFQRASNHEEMLSYIFKKFLHWTGLKKASEVVLAEERDARLRSKYID